MKEPEHAGTGNRRHALGNDILDFDEQIAAEVTAKPPIEFRFHGEMFKAHGDGPGMVLLRFIRAAKENDGLTASSEMLGFLEQCMPADEFTRFAAICDDPDTSVPVEHLGIVVRGLMAKYEETDQVGDARPTQPSAQSPTGPSTTGTGSAAGSSNNESA